ncbi:hypothetical protein ACHAXA_005394 [Cyclostephanos tholiformis]|uniref:Metallo-beta-lactamase domain-containing protein n=1 Tax=Cyclostephanos tholiformis TaxID=382380 RepID=A0ABD3RE63_9STRA
MLLHKLARWGHLKIFDLVLRRNGGRSNNADDTPGGGDDDDESRKKKKGKGSRKDSSSSSGVVIGAADGHSRTLHSRTNVIPDRVYVHPIPNFITNPILVDCGESDRILRHVDRIYERYYMRNYPRRPAATSSGPGIELYGMLCTHHHHDHTADVGRLRAELISRRMTGGGVGEESGGVMTVTAGCGGGGGVHGNADGGTTIDRENSPHDERPSADVYESSPGNVVVVGGAVDNVPHCNLFVKNGCFVPLPCVALVVDGGHRRANDMNSLVSIEVIGAPGHTRGSVVYALRNRPAPGVLDVSNAVAVASTPTLLPPPQSHLFTGDVIFCGGCGVPFEADLEYRRDDLVGNQMALKRKHGSSALRPEAGIKSMERCFVEVLIRAGWATSGGGEQRRTSKFWTSSQSSRTLPSQAAASAVVTSRPTILLYPGHEYTTDLLMRQFDLKKIDAEVHWSKLSPSTFFEVASHYLVSLHRRGLPPNQRILTIPTPLEREIVVNPNFRMLRRRGERLADALRLWYEFGANGLIPDRDDTATNETNAINSTVSYPTVFTTVYTADLQNVVNKLRNGKLNASSAADQLESMHTKLDELLIGRRPIPSTLPSHKNVYLGILAMAMLGSAPSAMTVSDAVIMNLTPPADSSDSILISKSRLIAALNGLGILSSKDYSSPRLEDIIHLLWQEAQLDYDELKLEIEVPNGRDIECSIIYEDNIELGLLKLALFGVAFNQPRTKMCMPCFGAGPNYDEMSWVKGKLRRTNGELVRHDARICFVCQ